MSCKFFSFLCEFISGHFFIALEVFYTMGCHSVVVITTAQLPSSKPEFRFCAGSNPAHGVSEIHNGEDI